MCQSNRSEAASAVSSIYNSNTIFLLHSRTWYLDGLRKESSNSTWDTGSKRVFELSDVLFICHAMTCGMNKNKTFISLSTHISMQTQMGKSKKNLYLCSNGSIIFHLSIKSQIMVHSWCVTSQILPAWIKKLPNSKLDLCRALKCKSLERNESLTMLQVQPLHL